MGRLSKSALLEGSDLEERDVELPGLGGSVRVRALGAAYTLQAQSEATEVKQSGLDQFVNVNRAKLEILQALHGLIDPKLDTYEEAERFAQQCGPSFSKVIEVIDEISAVDKKAIEDANTRFQSGGSGEAGPVVGDANGTGASGPAVPVRAGAGAEDEPASTR